MRTQMLFVIVLALTLTPAALTNAKADCSPWGASLLRGDAIYPDGWITSFSVIEISPPDEFVYAIIDGAASPQQFVTLKAKLRNRITDHAMGPGTVTAFARYYARRDYKSDLSTKALNE